MTRRAWLARECQTAVEWYLELCAPNLAPADLAAAILKGDWPEGTKHCWLASPFHAVLIHHRAVLMQEMIEDWDAEDAHALVEMLNPLLAQDGLSLHSVGEVLMLCADRPWDVHPPHFSTLLREGVPDRHPQGRDAGRWVRLLTEVQMRMAHARDWRAGKAKVHGLWFWGGSLMGGDKVSPPPVISRDPLLARLPSQGAQLAILQAKEAGAFLEENVCRKVLLAGRRCAVLLTPGWFASRLKRPWLPKRYKTLDELGLAP